MSGISALIKGGPKSPLTHHLPPCEDTVRSGQCAPQGKAHTRTQPSPGGPSLPGCEGRRIPWPHYPLQMRGWGNAVETQRLSPKKSSPSDFFDRLPSVGQRQAISDANRTGFIPACPTQRVWLVDPGNRTWLWFPDFGPLAKQARVLSLFEPQILKFNLRTPKIIVSGVCSLRTSPRGSRVGKTVGAMLSLHQPFEDLRVANTFEKFVNVGTQPHCLLPAQLFQGPRP